MPDFDLPELDVPKESDSFCLFEARRKTNRNLRERFSMRSNVAKSISTRDNQVFSKFDMFDERVESDVCEFYPKIHLRLVFLRRSMEKNEFLMIE